MQQLAIQSQSHEFLVYSSSHAKQIAASAIKLLDISEKIILGTPEVDDRYDIWRVPLLDSTNQLVGETVINAMSAVVDCEKSTDRSTLIERLSNRKLKKVYNKPNLVPIFNETLDDTIILGDSEKTLKDFPSESVHLMFTSPPYYNARPGYADYCDYSDYLTCIENVVKEISRVLISGRFAVVNVAPVLIRRASRSQSSRRIAVPFDIHQIFVSAGFEFVEDIIWEKPSGAGWATGRGRRFSADRNPLQYKTVPVTEYVLVYRKKSDKLIDWFIRKHPKPEIVEKSKILGDYDVTNIWRISPARSKEHPAVFPLELAKKVVQYYSFEEDVVIDPYAGIGTTGLACIDLNRTFILCERKAEYVESMKKKILKFNSQRASKINYVNCEAPSLLALQEELFGENT